MRVLKAQDESKVRGVRDHGEREGIVWKNWWRHQYGGIATVDRASCRLMHICWHIMNVYSMWCFRGPRFRCNNGSIHWSQRNTRLNYARGCKRRHLVKRIHLRSKPTTRRSEAVQPGRPDAMKDRMKTIFETGLCHGNTDVRWLLP